MKHTLITPAQVEEGGVEAVLDVDALAELDVDVEMLVELRIGGLRVRLLCDDILAKAVAR